MLKELSHESAKARRGPGRFYRRLICLMLALIMTRIARAQETAIVPGGLTIPADSAEAAAAPLLANDLTQSRHQNRSSATADFEFSNNPLQSYSFTVEEPARALDRQWLSLGTESNVPRTSTMGTLPTPATSGRRVPELITDRPDQTESSVTVPPGYAQLEMGWTFTRDDEVGSRIETHQFPSTLVRIGLLKWMEVRLGWTGYAWEDFHDASRKTRLRGSGDTEIGVKLHLRSESEKGFWPEIALLAGTSVPSGNHNFTTRRADPSTRFSFSHTLSDRVGLGYNLGMSWESELNESGKRVTLSNYLYTLALGVSITNRWGGFVEFFGDIPASAQGKPANSFDGGFTYLLRSNLQVDVFSGVGLSRAADDWFVGAGLSLRLPR